MTAMRVLLLSLLLAAGLVAAGRAVQPANETPQAVLDRAVADFLAGRLTEAVAGFDRVVALAPAATPQLWQRGIALYYAGRHRDCRAQFESHRTVNPNDVENAAWHFLCVARLDGAAAARAALLPVGPDPRRPMREVYELFRGAITPDAVIAAAGDGDSGLFYAHLYIGLYFDASGDRARAREHIAAAADDRFARVGGYMHAVARQHLASLK